MYIWQYVPPKRDAGTNKSTLTLLNLIQVKNKKKNELIIHLFLNN